MRRKMFGAIKQFLKKAQAIDQQKMLQEILSEPELDKKIVTLNQDQMYEQGLQADGKPTGEYKLHTKVMKLTYGDARGTPGRIDHITGLDTGITYDSINVKSQPEGIVINADDRNNFFGRVKRGLGLTDESIQKIIPEVREKVIQKTRKAIS